MSLIRISLPASRVVRIAFLLACGVLATGCDGAGVDGTALAPAEDRLPAETLPTHAPSGPPPVVGQTDRFAVEEALGAQCRANWNGEPPLQGAACYGQLPEHVAALLRSIPGDHPYLTAEQREQGARSKQWFRAVQGYGSRPDFVAQIDHTGDFWIRSFEGLDPDSTVYVVYGPSCSDDPGLSMASVDAGCLPGAPYVVRALRIYRVQGGARPEDVTRTLAPPPPTMTAAERLRYGIYLRPESEGPAEDEDIGLIVGRLDASPVMRWVIDPAEEGDYEKPKIPDTDPRGVLHMAHFGFLVWDGKRFELREKIPLSLWACGLAPFAQGECLEGVSSELDPYLLEDSASDLPGKSTP